MLSRLGLRPGSTHIITPDSFMKDLRALGRGGIGGNAPTPLPLHPQSPGRPNRSPGQKMPYQAIMDYRYWQPPVGPPSLAPPVPPPPVQNKHSRPNMTQAFSDMSLSSAASGGSSRFGKDKDGKDKDKKKRNLFKLKWDK